jgi:hypothetical protein
MGCQLLTYSSIRTSDVRDFLEFTDGRRKLPLKSVLLTFDGGHGAFCNMPPMFKEPSEPAQVHVRVPALGGST